MIVRPVADGVHLITQPDHARLARTIMEDCVALQALPRREDILVAIAGHDSGWADEDANPIVDIATGGVLDFVHAPLAVRQAGGPRAMQLLAGNAWAAALVAQHALTSYERRRDDAEWALFFKDMEAARDARLAECGRALDELLADYAFVRLGDLISLAFCTGRTSEYQYREWTIEPSGARIVVTPDAFGGAIIPFEVAAKALRNPAFRSDAELREAVGAAPAVTLRGEVGGRVSE